MSEKQFSTGLKISIAIACVILVIEIVLVVIVLNTRENTTTILEGAEYTAIDNAEAEEIESSTEETETTTETDGNTVVEEITDEELTTVENTVE